MSTPAPLVIAHRGASGYLPEHTEAAFRLALQLGADAVEPDVVPSRDGVLVVRHENELSMTTDVADRPDLADRRTTKEVDGRPVEGWFTEDLTWSELATLRAREPHPDLRPDSARWDGRWPVLRLADVLRIVAEHGAPTAHVVVEVKHPTTFAAAGLPMPELLDAELDVAEVMGSSDWLTVESFERSVLMAVAARGLDSRRVYLTGAVGAAFDLVARDGEDATTYAAELADPASLATLEAPERAGSEPLLHGISVAKDLLLRDRDGGRQLVDHARSVGLETWAYTLRPENRFLAPRHRDGPEAAHGHWRQELSALLDTGLAGVFADHPDLVRAALPRETRTPG
ncbi:glycerophosphodiester phosphodiesterase family protein [Promicromonospora vindobonensis]|uniref:glycerophosphodiester phosphodiesterase n=1 Tax=Promicromonospora vindobonensis TaxID=195748 RepID=A0ABW5VUC6_9MICO